MRRKYPSPADLVGTVYGGVLVLEALERAPGQSSEQQQLRVRFTCCGQETLVQWRAVKERARDGIVACRACSVRAAYQVSPKPKPKPKPKQARKTPAARYRIKDPALALALSGAWR